MPHHHHRHIHHVHEKRGAWDQLTSVAGSVWNDVFSTENKAKTAPSTIYHTVYTTMTPAGWDGGSLSTIPPVEAPTSTTTVFPDASDTLQITSATQSPDSPETSTLPASTSSSSVTLPSTLAVASPSTTARASFTQQAAATTTGAAPATASSNAASSDGDPGVAAKAGIAIGVLAGILAVFLAVWFLFNRRRKQMEERSREDDEKRDGPFSDSHAITNTASTAVKAPRLSLRPVTQFLPNLNPHPDRRASRGAAIAMTLSPTQNTNRNLVGGRTDDYSAMNSSANNVNNPFGSHAERIHTPIPEESMPVSPVSPIESEVGTAITTHSPPRGTPATLSNNVPVAAGTGLARKASMRKESAPMPLDLTRPAPLDAIPPSPAGTEFSVHSVAPGQTPGPSGSAAAIAAAGGPPQSTVHRVQLDFKPTLEDEMELRAGQLVRLLHEYDDGWALCIRLDRSQQGVVPRTCLSTRPVKPRPAPGGGRPGPPVNPNRGPGYPPTNRAMAPQGGPHGGPPYPRPGSAQSRRQSPPEGYPMGSYGGPGPHSAGGARSMSPGPRAMSPADGQRSQSPSPQYQQGRPQSPNDSSRRMSPPGQSQMNQEYRTGPPVGPVGRKPVPGQAS